MKFCTGWFGVQFLLWCVFSLLLFLFGWVKFTLKLVDIEPQRMKKKKREKSCKNWFYFDLEIWWDLHGNSKSNFFQSG